MADASKRNLARARVADAVDQVIAPVIERKGSSYGRITDELDEVTISLDHVAAVRPPLPATSTRASSGKTRQPLTRRCAALASRPS